MSSLPAFLDCLDIKGYDPERVTLWMRFIDAPDPPIELARVIDNFVRTIPYLRNLIKLNPEYDLDIALSEWERFCSEIKTDPLLRKMLIETGKKGKMPLKGRYDSNPVYVAIWQRPVSASDQKVYFILLAHCLLAIAVLRNRMDKQKRHGLSKQVLDDFNGNIHSALLAVRNLTASDQTTLDTLPDLNVTPEKLLSILAKDDNEQLAPIRVLFKYFLDIRKPPHRQHDVGRQQRGPKREYAPRLDLPAFISELSSNLDPEQDDSASAITLLQLPSVSETQQKNTENHGCSPSEEFSGVEIVMPGIRNAERQHVQSAEQRAFKKRRIKTQLAMINQRLTARWEVLSNYEVSVCLNAVADLIAKKDRSVYLQENARPEELAALLTALFWFGQRLESIAKLKVYHHDQGNWGAEPGFVSVPNQNGYWWTKPAVPERKILPDSVQQRQVHHTVSNFALFSGIGVEQIIDSYLDKIHCHCSVFLFPKKLEFYEQIVNGFLASVNCRHATRLTANRLSDYLFNAIERHEGADVTAAMFIVGREHFLGRNPSFYTALSTTQLQKLYKDTCTEIMERHFQEQPCEDQRRVDENVKGILPEAAPASHVGSPFRPTVNTVANLVAVLKSSLKNAAQSDSSVLKLLRLHNNMTRYTAFMIAFSTGFRAIRDPFLSSAEIDWNSGFAVLSDKDNEDGYNSRLIWVPPVCLQQLAFFREHQQNVLCRLNILIPNIYSMLERPRRTGAGRYMFFTKEGHDRGEYIAITAGPARLGSKLRNTYALPFNASRHYLRSTLLERKCPVEAINAFLGHFERGEEPWGAFSGLSPRVYREVLIEHLVPILVDDGWEAIQGLGAVL